MAFELNDKTYLLAVWYVEAPGKLPYFGPFGNGGNMMFMLWRDGGPLSKWQLRYRFRYYNPDGDDLTSWYDVIGEDVPDDMIINRQSGMVMQIAGLMKANTGEIDFYPVKGSALDWLETMRVLKPEWFHEQVETVTAIATEAK